MRETDKLIWFTKLNTKIMWFCKFWSIILFGSPEDKEPKIITVISVVVVVLVVKELRLFKEKFCS